MALAREHRDTVMIGRTHGVHAEPTTFGAKVALWALQVDRDRTRLRAARETVAVMKLSGAVGTYSNIPPAVEAHVGAALDLTPVPATQVIARDRHAEFLYACASIAATCEMVAVELRHLQRTEVGEVLEGFKPGQKGSSAMPHKRNPISAETISGLARVVRSNLLAGLQDVALWHERDISHSSVERVVLPDSSQLAHYMMRRLTRLAERPAGVPRADAPQPRRQPRTRVQPAGAAGARRGRAQPRRRLPGRAAQRDAGVGRAGRLQVIAGGRPRRRVRSISTTRSISHDRLRHLDQIFDRLDDIVIK